MVDYSFGASLKECAKKKGLRVVYSSLRIESCQNRILGKKGARLVTIYARCGALTKAREVLSEIPFRTVVSWNALIAGYTQQGQGELGTACFDQMRSEGLSPNAMTYASTLKACGITRTANKGEQIHEEILSQGLLGHDVVLGTALVDMYVKCKSLRKAQRVLDELPDRSIITWNALLAGYAKEGQGEMAMDCFGRMQSEDVSPNAVTYGCLLKAFGKTQDVQLVKIIHEEISSQGFLGKEVMLGTALVNMYARCSLLTEAQQVFDKLCVHDVVSWNALIAGYVQQDQGEDAMECFHKMLMEGLSPDMVTYACILKTCSITKDVDKGIQIHDEIVTRGLLVKNVVLGNCLVDMYAKCGMLLKAQEVLHKLSVRDVVSWNALIAGYTQNEQGVEAIECYEGMLSEGIRPDVITYACILKACGITRQLERGIQIHDEIGSQGILGRDVVLGTALVEMYAQCGALDKAQEVLDTFPARDVVSWNTLIAGYAQQGYGDEAMDCFDRMRTNGFAPNAATYACILKACSLTSRVDIGRQIHDEIVSQGLLGRDIVLGNALVDMYAKCGMVTKAGKVLEELPLRDVVSWNALIGGYAQQGQAKEAWVCLDRMQREGLTPDLVSWNGLVRGYAQHGQGEEALDCLGVMQREGISPDATTLIFVLTACSHSGLVIEGQMVLESMRRKYGIVLDIEHQICMVDLFGRAGHFLKAMMVIREMLVSDYPPLWSALLGACHKWGNVKLGRLAFEHAVNLDPFDAAPYVCMENIYGAAGMQEEARKIKAARVKNAAFKDPEHAGWVNDLTADVD